MSVDWYFSRLASHEDRDALITRQRRATYAELLAVTSAYQQQLVDAGVGAGDVVAITGLEPFDSCAAFLALAKMGAIMVPLAAGASIQHEAAFAIAEVQYVLTARNGALAIEPRASNPTGALLIKLRERGHPGLVLFSSGSTGKPKAALHDFEMLVERYRQPRKGMRTILFLLLDHIGGINTLLHALANGGAVIVPSDRAPEAVCKEIEEHQVELLPTSPTFLNMLLMSEAHTRFSLSSLRLITYGTEVMPEATLLAIRKILPNARLQQTYGMTEVGILRTRSKDSSSLWMQLGGDGFETKIVDGTLWVRAQTAMLGYLNAESPFDADGWLNTGDRVEVEGDHLRILGRTSEIINVGGEKVYPAEVESVLLQLPNVASVTVFGHRSPITGQIVGARVQLREPEELASLQRRIREECAKKLKPYQIPRKIEITESDDAVGPRFKKIRSQG